MKSFHLFALGMFLVILVALSRGFDAIEQPPAAQRSLEKIDYIGWHTFGGSGLYLYRVMTCYYVVAFGDNR
jgi:hypothetical protein